MSLREELERAVKCSTGNVIPADDWEHLCTSLIRDHGHALLEAVVKLESENERIGAFVRRVEREGASNLHQSMAHAFITHALSGEHDEAV